MVPLAGIEPALLAESDFESDASTSSAIGARAKADGRRYRTRPRRGSMRGAARRRSPKPARSAAEWDDCARMDATIALAYMLRRKIRAQRCSTPSTLD